MAVKEHWGSRLGFVLAAAGSAVGLGNLWGFAYRASQGGGGAFLLLYVLIVLVVCLPVLVAEMVLGRSTGHSPLLAPVTAAGKGWQSLGWLFIVASCGILAFYAVLMGWTGHTLIHSLFVGLPADQEAASTFFAGVSKGNSVLVGQGLSLVLTAAVVATGVQGGIERLSRWALPLLFALLIGLAIWASGLAGAAAGRETFLLNFDSAQLFNLTTIRNAFNQAFFSIGTGIGCILAYAAYLDRRAHLPREAVAVVGMDTAVGLLAGLVTFPVVMSFGLENTVGESTIGALFISIPTGLASLGQTGQVVAVLFFFLAYLAAITSSVSLLEVPVASLVDRLGWTRRRAVTIAAAVIFVLGLPSATYGPALDFMSDVFGGVLLIVGGLLISLLMGWRASARFREDLAQSGTPLGLRRLLLFSLRWVSPLVIAIGLVISLWDLLGGWSSALCPVLPSWFPVSWMVCALGSAHGG